MTDALRFVMLASLLCGSVSPSVAHHSFVAEFDPAKLTVLQGAVTKLEWTNPHARLYVIVKGDDGLTTDWEVELGSPNTLLRYGWKRDTLGIGDVVTIDGYRARDGHFLINAKSVKLPNGNTVTAGSSYKTGSSTGESKPP